MWSLGCRSCSNGQKFRLRRRVLYDLGWVDSLPSANRRFLSSKIGLTPPHLREAVLKSEGEKASNVLAYSGHSTPAREEIIFFTRQIHVW